MREVNDEGRAAESRERVLNRDGGAVPSIARVAVKPA
jgi:hypothetical protein